MRSGLKSQHVTSIQWLADATDADTEGLSVGSSTLQFIPRKRPVELSQRKFSIVAESGAASTLLVLQAILPFLLFAGSKTESPIELEISGGTNVHWSLSYEYLDQVLLPTLEDRFHVQVERQLKKRGWSLGPSTRGLIWLKVYPLSLGQALKINDSERRYSSPKDFEVKQIDVSINVPLHVQAELQEALVKDLGSLFPDSDVNFVSIGDSGDPSRLYALLVARSESGLRWGRDILSSTPKKSKNKTSIVADLSRKVSRDLFKETELMSTVDEFLQDQVIIYQALAEGRSSFPRTDNPPFESGPSELKQPMADLQLGERMRKDKADEPFGHGSLHTQTARWVVSKMLPGVQFFNKGEICQGVGICFKEE
jgi:RNA 3'-terminal phosphate cyclase (ATP)